MPDLNITHYIEPLLETQYTDVSILYKLASQIVADPFQDPDAFCAEARLLSKHIPQNIKASLQSFAKEGSSTGFLLLRELMCNNNTQVQLPQTPPNNTLHVGETTILAKVQAILASAIGEMIAYEAEGEGRLFQDIVPAKSMNNLQTSLSSVELEIHTEQCFSRFRPDILTLACLRGDYDALTYVLPVQTILNHLTKSEIAALRLPLWKTRVDMSFKLNGEEFLEGDVRGPFPIISGSEQDPQLLFDQDLMFGITQDAEELIEKILNIYYKYREHHNLEAGDIIFIDNNRAVHGRSSFNPRYDGLDRFLTRCFVVFDYEKSKYVRRSRTLIAKHS
jgi:L-asparagine oxygenase